MYEVKEAIVLAAGSSRRMGEYTRGRPKCLLQYSGETILKRLIKQLKENNIKKIIIVVGYRKELVIEELERSFGDIEDIKIKIVENKIYDQDTNIYSMKLALEQVEGPFVIFEADTVMENDLVRYVVGADFEGKSVWFTNSDFNEELYGGILKTDDFGKIIDIRIVPQYEDIYRDYRKLTGLMRVGTNEKDLFKELVDKYAGQTIKQYYLIPWIENLKDLPCVDGNAEHYLFKTFNKPEEYEAILEIEFDEKPFLDRDIVLIEIEKLKHVEGFDDERAALLVEKIQNDGIWTLPVYIEKNHNIVLDGQHRVEAARKMDLKYIPVIGFDYNELSVWTLRKEEKVDVDTVVRRVNSGNIYPYKTVKHRFPYRTKEKPFVLSDLKKERIIESQIPPTIASKKRLIILAAGQGFKLDGFNKLMIRDPKTRETILEKYKRLFKNYRVCVVVGYRAIELMSEHPELDYVENEDWRITGNSYSLALTLDETPCVIISADLIFDEKMIDLIENSPENSVFFYNSENKGINTVRGKIENSLVSSLYMGEEYSDPEAVGIFKITDSQILRQWKRNCLTNKNVFAGINLPLDMKEISAVDISNLFFHEVNTPLDYLALIDKLRKNGP
jgi:choline kinase